MTNKTKGKLIKGGALTLDVGVPLAVTFSYFPLWVETSAETTVSGLAVIFVLVSILPMLRVLKNVIKTPSAPMIWAAIAVMLVGLSKIIDQAMVIAVSGAISNVAGSAIYKAGEKIESKE